ncbi:protein lin-54 homolog isoform X2 [Ruditapes philippinarum]|uniref:protein lin-54 homolog isoform X2 n=1 Tax=Ruditapes philippinarum TaxID=129788 RepID=UPI00295C25F5|nr:protein lin-54 homolog isoform X2 [Ruditapes philippinarum]
MLCIKDDKVRVIAIDSVTGQVINSSVQYTQSDSSSTGDSVDGSLPIETLTSNSKEYNTFQSLTLDNSDGSAIINDGTIYATTGFSSANNTVSAIGDNTGNLSFLTQAGSQVSSGGAVTIPQVIIVDSKDGASLLGKRQGESLSQNSLVNKIIITKNTISSQSQGVPIQVQTLPVTQTAGTQPGSTDVLQGQKTPTKTITISQQGIVSPGKGIMMAQVAGTPPKLPINKLPISPAKTPTKITMIPMPVPGRSPQRIAPAGLGQTLLSNSSTSTVQATITMSPSKVMKQPGTVHVIQKPIQPSISNATVLHVPRTVATNAQGVRQVLPANLQQIHVPGNKFHYIRLANPSSSTGARAQLIPVSVPSGQTGQPVKITIPAQSTNQIVTSRPNVSTVQRIILPAGSNQVAIRPAPPASVAQGTQLIRTTLPAGTGTLAQIAPSGTSFISTGPGSTPGVQGFALVPASYLSQIQQQVQAKPVVTTVASSNTTEAIAKQIQTRNEYVPIASNNPALSANTQTKNVNGASLDGAGGARQRKPCNCTKSQCLKLYCDCFANGEFCHSCNCTNCANNLEHEEDRSRAIKSCLDRNPLAFHPKIGKGKTGEKDRRHNKGCNCKRSGCLKNYCECYEAKIMCSSSCKCVGCKNFEESPELKTLMHLADAAEVRVQQQTAAKTKLSSQISDLPSRPVSSVTGERLPFSFVTSEVVEATCACLLAQAEEADRQKMPPVVQERMVIEEFGRCLMQIIESANRTKAPDPDDTG